MEWLADLSGQHCKGSPVSECAADEKFCISECQALSATVALLERFHI